MQNLKNQIPKASNKQNISEQLNTLIHQNEDHGSKSKQIPLIQHFYQKQGQEILSKQCGHIDKLMSIKNKAYESMNEADNTQVEAIQLTQSQLHMKNQNLLEKLRKSSQNMIQNRLSKHIKQNTVQHEKENDLMNSLTRQYNMVTGVLDDQLHVGSVISNDMARTAQQQLIQQLIDTTIKENQSQTNPEQKKQTKQINLKSQSKYQKSRIPQVTSKEKESVKQKQSPKLNLKMKLMSPYQKLKASSIQQSTVKSPIISPVILKQPELRSIVVADTPAPVQSNLAVSMSRSQHVQNVVQDSINQSPLITEQPKEIIVEQPEIDHEDLNLYMNDSKQHDQPMDVEDLAKSDLPQKQTTFVKNKVTISENTADEQKQDHEIESLKYNLKIAQQQLEINELKNKLQQYDIQSTILLKEKAEDDQILQLLKNYFSDLNQIGANQDQLSDEQLIQNTIVDQIQQQFTVKNQLILELIYEINNAHEKIVDEQLKLESTQQKYKKLFAFVLETQEADVTAKSILKNKSVGLQMTDNGKYFQKLAFYNEYANQLGKDDD